MSKPTILRTETEIKDGFVASVVPFAKFQRDYTANPEWRGFNIKYPKANPEAKYPHELPIMVSDRAILAVSDDTLLPTIVDRRTGGGEWVVQMRLYSPNSVPNTGDIIEIPVDTLEKLNPEITPPGKGGAKSYKKRFNRSNRNRNRNRTRSTRRCRSSRRGHSNKK